MAYVAVVPFLPYGEWVKLIDAIANSRHDYEVGRMFGEDDPLTVMTFTNADAFAMLRFRRPDNPHDRVRAEIAGGGGVGARPEPALFTHLFRRSQTFHWGGPFAAEHPDGTVTYGSRIALPSALMSLDNRREAGSFIVAMLDEMGTSARRLATEGIPLAGGAPLDGSDRQHATLLLAALMGPPPTCSVRPESRIRPVRSGALASPGRVRGR